MLPYSTAPISAQPSGTLDLCWYATRPWSFFLRYMKRRPIGHGLILVGIMAAVGCSVGTQYGVKGLVDALTAGPGKPGIWHALAILMSVGYGVLHFV